MSRSSVRKSARVIYEPIDLNADDFDFENIQEERDDAMILDEPDHEQAGEIDFSTYVQYSPPTDEAEYVATGRDPVQNIAKDRIIIAVDFGTTFSSVAYVVLPQGVRPDAVGPDDVKCISNYPGQNVSPGRREMADFLRRQEVPTELWYDDGYVERLRQDPTHNNEQPAPSSATAIIDDSESSDDEILARRRRRNTQDVRMAQDTSVSKPPTEQYWGYQVQSKLSMNAVIREDAAPLNRFKLYFNDDLETAEVRRSTKELIKSLKRRKVIKEDADICRDYLTHLLRHTKSELEASRDLSTAMLTQFVLCVPARWPAKACRVLQNALEGAVNAVDFGPEANLSVHDVFIISEPEAAAEWILAEDGSGIMQGETVVIVDAGGGTIDAVTYLCENEDPLRLGEEVVAPDSKLQGASYINERFERLLLQKLAGETYLVDQNTTIKTICQARTVDFENYQKRIVDIFHDKNQIHPIIIPYLRPNASQNFYEGAWAITSDEIEDLFRPSLKAVRKVLKSQLELAKDRRIEKLVLTGGFGQSPSLQTYLRQYLEERNKSNGLDTKMIVPETPTTAVAKGAVLRALNKREGPKRYIQCSYGFIISELYQPKAIPAHAGTRPRISEVTGSSLVDETIQWIIEAGQKVENGKSFPVPVMHTFPLDEERLISREALWVSDTNRPNHYRKTHASNKGAELVGEIETDLTFLREQGLLEKKCAISGNNVKDRVLKEYWEVHYEVALVVEGRSIRFEARWPDEDSLKQGETQRILDARLIGIAAAFLPGTE